MPGCPSCSRPRCKKSSRTPLQAQHISICWHRHMCNVKMFELASVATLSRQLLPFHNHVRWHRHLCNMKTFDLKSDSGRDTPFASMHMAIALSISRQPPGSRPAVSPRPDGKATVCLVRKHTTATQYPSSRLDSGCALWMPVVSRLECIPVQAVSTICTTHNSQSKISRSAPMGFHQPGGYNYNTGQINADVS